MRTLVIGGARSGKTAVAESLLAGRPEVTYVATGYVEADDPDWSQRVARHRALRPPSWTTLESIDLVTALTATGGPLLVDCLTLWLTRVMDRAGCWDEGAGASAGHHALELETAALLDAVRTSTRDLVLVTNEVGQGVVPDSWSGRRFRDEMGKLNSAVASACDEVLLCVAGRTLSL